MKERPILFSAPMVRAILLGSKTQTRRVVKHHPSDDGNMVLVDHGDGWWPYRSDDGERPVVNGGDEIPYRCPYGQPGDRLWVREGFSGPHYREAFPPSLWHELDEIHYWADGNPVDGDWTRPRPSIHMPRWASRILLEVVAVRVERLNEISEADAIAEGVERAGDRFKQYMPMFDASAYDPALAKSSYSQLWESINGPGSWDANPWVWVVEFERIP